MSDLLKRAGVYKKFRCDYFFPTIVNVKKTTSAVTYLLHFFALKNSL